MSIHQEVDLEKFKDLVYFFPCSVHILATDGIAGKRAITVSSVLPFSFSPPSMLVCVQKGRENNQLFLQNKVFSINTLSQQHEELIGIFGGRTNTTNCEKFNYLKNKTLKTGAPILPKAYLVFDCILDAFYEHATHYILIGKVVDVYRDQDTEESKLLLRAKNQFFKL